MRILVGFTVIVLACGVLAGADTGSMTVAYAVTAAVCAGAALWFDGFVGLGVGLAATTAYVALRRLTGTWEPEALILMAAQVAALLVLGWVAGMVGRHLTWLGRPVGHDASAVTAAHHSLGLLGREPGMLRLQEEIARGSRRRSPVGLLVVSVEITATTLDDTARTGAHRVVARLVESLVSRADVPFAASEHEFAAILTDSTPARAWEMVTPLVESIQRAHFADREGGQRRVLADVAHVTTGFVFATASDTAESLLERARGDSIEPRVVA